MWKLFYLYFFNTLYSVFSDLSFYNKVRMIGKIPSGLQGTLIFSEDSDQEGFDPALRLDKKWQQRLHFLKIGATKDPHIHIKTLKLNRYQQIESDYSDFVKNPFLGQVFLQQLKPESYLVGMTHDIPSILDEMPDGSMAVTKNYYNKLEQFGGLSTPLRTYGDSIYFGLSSQEPFNIHQTLIGINRLTGDVFYKRGYRQLFSMNDFLILPSGRLLFITGMPKDSLIENYSGNLTSFRYQESTIHAQDGAQKHSTLTSFNFKDETHITDLLCATEERERVLLWFYGVRSGNTDLLRKESVVSNFKPTLHCVELNFRSLKMKTLYEDTFTSLLKPPAFIYNNGKDQLNHQLYWTSTYPSVDTKHNRLASVVLKDEQTPRIEYLEFGENISPPVLLSRSNEETLLATLSRQNHGQRLMIHNTDGVIYAQGSLGNNLGLSQHRGQFFPER
ncbi:hypothetical protein EBR43_07100 [bacterium]|nr:hypothetical protein [bacterium]